MEYRILHQVNVPLLYLLKTPENQICSGVFKGLKWKGFPEMSRSILKSQCCFELSVIDSTNKHKGNAYFNSHKEKEIKYYKVF